MVIDLNDRHAIETLDASHTLASIDQLPDQIEDAWTQTAQHEWRDYVNGVDHVVVSGMGGSALGARVIQSLAKQALKVPLEIVNDYSLPGYVNNKTLVILSSYSGTTEETLAAAKQAEAKQARIAVITSGGDLHKLMVERSYPGYLINPIHNPSNQPRMAIGYAIAGQIGLLNSFGLIDSSSFNINETVDFLRSQASKYQPEAVDNQAIQLARQFQSKIIYLISAEHLIGATHVVNNQFNENAKHLTVELVLPELNHHYMEGLPHPESAQQNCIFWLIDSSLYSERLKLRVRLTKDVIEKNKYQTQIVTLTSSTPLTQVFELIQLGSYTNFYTAMLDGIDPAPIPWVDYFKAQLHKAS